MKILRNLILIFVVTVFALFEISCKTTQSAQKDSIDRNGPAPLAVKPVRLKGFEVSPYWNEQVKTYNWDTDVRIQINAPSAETFDAQKPIRLILYTLPNGNSIEWTVGKKLKEGDDWHFNIQHIGAQTRRLREVMTGENIVVAYLEAKPKSWPNYRSRHEDNPKLINEMVQWVIHQMPYRPKEIVLSSHSGGGSFIFGFINGNRHIPNWVNRISFIDSIYAYSDDSDTRHGTKMIEWLKENPHHFLSIITYLDTNILYNGKPVRGAISFQKTHEMVDRFSKNIPLSCTTTGDLVHWQGMNGQLDIITNLNPENKILHTVLVEKNGFIHAMTTGTPYENKAGVFWADHAYDQWIQPDVWPE